MMARYTKGKYAFAICDRCGDKIKFSQLKTEWTGLRVCPECLDPKTKQEFPTNFTVDPESLKDPRPDNDQEANAGKIEPKDNSTGDTPIGKSYNGFKPSMSLGTVTVTIT